MLYKKKKTKQLTTLNVAVEMITNHKIESKQDIDHNFTLTVFDHNYP